ncbi:MAG: hydroxyethylthiazole kinase [Oscillospiraceae bacterium]|nr:hydroxyethylthiazole kinase [Oscillospiraceae bacterium]
MLEKINEIRTKVREKSPLIHAITNPISINQCANAVLAVGAKPIMAEHPEEVGEITKRADALLLNLGNITDTRVKSMLISVEMARQENIPVVVDVVGVSCSTFRKRFAKELIEKGNLSIIKGNYSEIKALFEEIYTSRGVDCETEMDEDIVKKLSQKFGAIVLASGKTDIVSDGKKLITVNNGTAELAKVTGTGCMLGILCACYLSVCDDICAALSACTVLGICGERSKTKKGGGSFFVNLMDNLSTLSDEDVKKHMKSEVKEFD